MAMNILAGIDWMQQQGEQGRQRRERNAFASLSQQVLASPTADPNAVLSQGYAVSPTVGAGLEQVAQSAEKRNYTRLGNMARLLVSMPEQARDQYYQQMKPSLQSMGINVAAKPTYDAEIGSLAQQLATMYAPGQNGMPTGFRELDMKARAAGFAPGTPEYQNAIKVALGVEGRASNAGFGFKEIEGLDGRTRLARNNPRTGAVEVYDETTGNFVPMGGVAGAGGVPGAPVEAEDGTMVATTQFSDATGQPISFGADIPPEFRQAVLSQPQQFAALPDNAAATLPPVNRSPAQFRGGNPALGVSRRPEDEAAAVEAAKQGVQLGYLPTQQAIETQGAVDRAQQLAPVEAAAAAERQRAEAAITAQTEREKKQREQSTVFAQYQAAIGGLRSGLANATTGPIAGRLPALTADAQIAEGSVAALAPVLKQLFRAAGEGTFTDRDQALLLEMVPTRTDLPAAREAKLQNIDNIVRAKLGQGGMYGAAPADAPTGNRLQTTSAVVGGGAPVRVQSAADYDALPSGALFIAPDGSQRRKR
jgi:hypothetical protein